ncbi:MAG: hypothetical protein H6753_03985 [Candidatus Omnitrophica bacterium]|nr:hypothetical protein [Candidatus Omnitrophota bacterium]
MSVQKKKILFVGEGASLAHIVRPLALSKYLDLDRFEISFACAEWYQWLIDDSGFTFHPLLTMPGEEFRQLLNRGKPLYDQQRLKEYIDSELILLKKISPDLVISDFRLSLNISTAVYQLPHIAFANAFWSPYSTQRRILPNLPIGKLAGRTLGQIIFDMSYPLASYLFHAKGINELRKSYHLPILKSLEEVYTCGNWTLYLDIPSLAPTKDLPSHQKYIGPILEMPHIPLPEWWQQWPKDKPIVYVSLGSTGDVPVLEKIIRSLDRPEITVLLATAQRITRKHWPKNFFVAPYIPGQEAAKNAHLMLFNGGSGSAYQPLSCGRPVIGFPTNMDQFLCISMIAAQGAGKLITSDKATIKNINSSIDEILSKPSYTKKAELLAKEIDQYNAVKNFIAFVDDWDRGKLTYD